MTDSFVQVPPDSTGKLIDSEQLQTNVGTVQRQRISVPEGVDVSGSDILAQMLVEQRVQNLLLQEGFGNHDNLDELRDELLGASESTAASRTVLTADTNYYVSPTGSDTSGNGSAGSPWLTPQHAYNWLCDNIEANSYNVIINHAGGTYAGVNMTRSVLNAAQVVFAGVSGSVGNVVWQEASGQTFCAGIQGRVGDRPFFENLTIAPATAGSGGIFMNALGQDVRVWNVNFTAPSGGGGKMIYFSDDASALAFGFNPLTNDTSGTSTISGNWSNAFYMQGLSQFFIEGTITLSGTPNFTDAFINLNQTPGTAVFSSTVSFSGSATGTRFKLSGGAGIETGTDNLTLLPGNAAGTFAGGSYYDEYSAVLNVPAPISGVFDVTFQGGFNVEGGNGVNRGVNFGDNGVADITVGSDILIGWSASTNPNAAHDTAFSRTAAATLALGSGTSGNATGTLKLATVAYTTTTVAGLGAAGTAGRRAFVTDATATTFASVVAGSGTNKVPVYDDGTNWRIG